MEQKIITVIDGENRIIRAKPGDLLSEVLSDNGITVPAVCAGYGSCRKCSVKLISGKFSGETPDSDGMIRSCKARVLTDAIIGIDFHSGSGLTETKIDAKLRIGADGIAVDIGTTTVAAALLSKDGSTKSASALNPQASFGADVISRIDACSKGSLNKLTSLIRGCIIKLISELTAEKVREIIISGNTTMLHIFCGISPAGMGTFPFTPEFTAPKHFSGEELGLNAESVTVLPCASAFIGSDIIAGIYALKLHKTDKRILFTDLGTNGETVISDRGRLLCASTAAGPALEGAGIECGTGGVSGAINRLSINNGKVSFSTIGGALPSGICSSGLIDAAAELLKSGKLDETGYLDGGILRICRNIFISQQDIRQFQLAKSAVYSGIQMLCKAAGIPLESLDTVYVAGGLGYYANTDNAVKTGLLPENLNISAVGNTSLLGALMCIGSPETVNEMNGIAESCETVSLAGTAEFSELFTENMLF
ncbi:MAG: ASKHA domain-containing protein [Clostridia bacterium]|nr:ASKHA domain-containing protein [Clostridia bacterium]